MLRKSSYRDNTSSPLSSSYSKHKKINRQAGTSEIKIIDSGYQTVKDEYASGKDLNTTKQSSISGTGTATQRFKSTPESPIGDCIERALKDLPTLPK